MALLLHINSYLAGEKERDKERKTDRERYAKCVGFLLMWTVIKIIYLYFMYWISPLHSFKCIKY